MTALYWITGIGVAFILLFAWIPSVFFIVPIVLMIYLGFIVALFVFPVFNVVIAWLVMAVVVIPLQLYKFPGQYTVARLISNLVIWPLLAPISLMVERQVTNVIPPSEVPRKFEAKVNYIDSPGTQGNYLMVFFEEFDETVFFCAGEAEKHSDLEEDRRFSVEVMTIDHEELGESILWIEKLKFLPK